MSNDNIKKAFEEIKKSLNKPPKELKADCGHVIYEPASSPAQAGYVYPFGEDKGKLLCYICFMERGIEHIEALL